MLCCTFFGDRNWFFNYDFFLYGKRPIDGDLVYNRNVTRDRNLNKHKKPGYLYLWKDFFNKRLKCNPIKKLVFLRILCIKDFHH